MHLTDYRVRVLDTAKGTGAVTRVLLDTADAEGVGRRSACPRTSSRPRGRPWWTRWCSASSGPPRVKAATQPRRVCAQEAAVPVRLRSRRSHDPAQVRPHHRGARGSRCPTDRRAGALEPASSRGEPPRALTSPGRTASVSPDPIRGRLELAKRFADQLVLEPGEHAEDVLAGTVGIALRRASIYGRARLPPTSSSRFAFSGTSAVLTARRHRATSWNSVGGASPEPRTTTGAAVHSRTRSRKRRSD